MATHDIFSERFIRENLDVRVICTGDLRQIGWWDGAFRIVSLLWALAPHTLVVIQGSFTDHTLLEMVAMLFGMRMRRGEFFDLQVSSPESPMRVSNRSWFAGAIPVGRIAGRVRRLMYAMKGRVPGNVVTVSHGAKQRMVQWFGYPQSTTQVVHHGIPVRDYYPDRETRIRIRSHLGIPEEATLIISTSRFTSEKNPDWIADAITRFSDRSEVWWLLAGDGPERPAFEQRVNATAAKERIIFLGHVHSTREYLCAADIFVLASNREGLSNAMLESMATGLLTVVTRVAGADDVISSGNNGIITDVSSAGVIAGINEALNLTTQASEHMRVSATQAVMRQFDREMGIHKMFKLLGLSHVGTEGG